jgi:hypothetical protein
MATTGTVTLDVTSFVPWVAGTQAAENCCKADGSLESSDNSKISITYPDPDDHTQFTINIGKHGSSTSLIFQITGDIEGYRSFIPIGIAFRPDVLGAADPTGALEFPSSSVAKNGDGERVLTVNVAKNFNELVTWDFYLVIQACPTDFAQPYNIGVIDPKIRGTTE